MGEELEIQTLKLPKFTSLTRKGRGLESQFLYQNTMGGSQRGIPASADPAHVVPSTPENRGRLDEGVRE
jgi:hypothetical protein